MPFALTPCQNQEVPEGGVPFCTSVTDSQLGELVEGFAGADGYPETTTKRPSLLLLQHPEAFRARK